jgi:hypothetical protein
LVHVVGEPTVDAADEALAHDRAPRGAPVRVAREPFRPLVVQAPRTDARPTRAWPPGRVHVLRRVGAFSALGSAFTAKGTT